MQEEKLADQKLVTALTRKLKRWQQLGEAPEYGDLPKRGPYKPTITHVLNRFGGQMGPYVDAQLHLQSVDYINASPIDNIADIPPFVATMCPKRTTFAHFWSMVWELGSTLIINLTHEKDRVGSEPTDKRERYWPPFDDEMTRQAQRWPVQPRTRGCENCSEVLGLQHFVIELTGPAAAGRGTDRPTRTVSLYWYSRWVDFPTSTSIGSRPFYTNAWNVLHMAMHLAKLLAQRGADHWAVCHCSAGVGRTGTFIALMKLLQQHSLGSFKPPDGESALDRCVAQTIERMRERRLWMVKTDTEFALLYAAVLLRLRNPSADDFCLTWQLVEGDCSSLQPVAGRPPEGDQPAIDNDADVVRYKHVTDQTDQTG